MASPSSSEEKKKFFSVFNTVTHNFTAHQTQGAGFFYTASSNLSFSFYTEAGEKRAYAEPRPGCTGHTTDASMSTITGFYNWRNNSSGDVLCYWGIESGGNAKLTLSGVTTYTHADSTPIVYLQETVNSAGTKSLTWTRGNGTDYWIYPAGGAVAQITTVPANTVGQLVHKDGWTFVAVNSSTGARIYNSNLNDPTTGYTDFISVNMHPDDLITLYEYKNYILAFGTQSIEWYEITENNVGSPLKRITSLFSDIGLVANVYTTFPFVPICNGNKEGKDTIFWIGCGTSIGSPSIFYMDGTTPKKIETNQTIEAVLSQITSAGQGSSFKSINFVKLGGHNYLICGLVSLTHALCFDLDNNIWNYWEDTTAEWGSIKSIDSTNNRVYIAGSGNKYSYFSNGYYGPAGTGTAYLNPWIVFSAHNESSGVLKFPINLSVIASHDLFATGNFTVGVKKDQATSYTNLLQFGTTRTPVTGIGRYFEATFRIVGLPSSYFRLEGLELRYRLGS